jgi:hypothetical protein
VVPVGCILDGEELVCIKSTRGRAIRRRGRAAGCVDGPGPPAWFVPVEGETRVTSDSAQLRAWAERSARRVLLARTEIGT